MTALAEAGVRFVVCGGVAAVLHGVERLTLDLDLAVDMETTNLQRMISVFRDIQLVPRAPVAAAIILDEEKRRLLVKEKNALVFTFVDTDHPYRQVDVMIHEEGLYDRLHKDAKSINLTGAQVEIASIAKLIAMKETVKPLRDKDRLDIAALKTLLKRDPGERT